MTCGQQIVYCKQGSDLGKQREVESKMNKAPEGGSKTKNGRFRSKSELFSKKVCYKVLLCENCQQKSCKAFIGLFHST